MGWRCGVQKPKRRARAVVISSTLDLAPYYALTEICYGVFRPRLRSTRMIQVSGSMKVIARLRYYAKRLLLLIGWASQATKCCTFNKREYTRFARCQRACCAASGTKRKHLVSCATRFFSAMATTQRSAAIRADVIRLPSDWEQRISACAQRPPSSKGILEFIENTLLLDSVTKALLTKVVSTGTFQQDIRHESRHIVTKPRWEIMYVAFAVLSRTSNRENRPIYKSSAATGIYLSHKNP